MNELGEFIRVDKHENSLIIKLQHGQGSLMIDIQSKHDGVKYELERRRESQDNLQSH